MQEEAEEAQSGFNYRDILAIAQMQWRIVLAGMVVGGVLAVLHGFLATQQFKATAMVRLSPVAGQEMKADRVVNDEAGRWNRQMFLQTQLEIIRSRSTLEEVLRRWDQVAPTAADDDDGYEIVALPTGEHRSVILLRQMLEATPRVGTELLDLSVTSSSPQQAQVLAELIATVFEEASLDQRKLAASQAVGWLEDKIATQDAHIDDLGRVLVAYQAMHDLADVDEQVTSMSARLSSLNASLAETRTERVLLETTVKAHKRSLRAGAFEALAKDMDTTLVSSLSADWARAVTEHAKVSARYGAKVPEYQSSQAQLDRIQEELEAEVRRTLKAEEMKLDLLMNKQEQLEIEIENTKRLMLGPERIPSDDGATPDAGDGDVAKAADLPRGLLSARGEYEKLRMELERAREFYVRLNQRKDELDLQAETQLNNVSIIDLPLEPKRAVWPNLPLNLALGLFGGLLGGLGLGLLREVVDDTISSPLEVSTFLRVPFLGLIPQIEEEQDETELALFSHRNPRSRVAEAMRGIRTVLELNPSGLAPKTLLVTSAVSSEGKTSTVVRLGVAFANLDKRVLMIDADLRRPRMHKIFGHDKIPGLAEVLSGEQVAQGIRATGVANLDYLASGKGGERPNERLASPKMPRLLESLSHDYDLVIIDSPPSVILSDARIMSRYADGVVMVVREHTTARGLIREAITGLEQVGADMLGVVVNAVDLAHRRTSYKYYYGYGYGYGYGRYGSPYLEADDLGDEASEEADP